MHRFPLTPAQCLGRLPFSFGQDVFIITDDVMQTGVIADILLDQHKEQNGNCSCSIVYLVTTPIGCYGKKQLY